MALCNTCNSGLGTGQKKGVAMAISSTLGTGEGWWLPAYSNKYALPKFAGFAFVWYPGGKKALLYRPGVKGSSWRQVLDTRQGGPTGLEVRLHANIPEGPGGFATGGSPRVSKVALYSPSTGGEDSMGLWQVNAAGSTITQQKIRQNISSRQWVPAVSTVHAAPDSYPWALYTGGKYAMLQTAPGVSKKRKVLQVRNGGPTGLEVRLGHPIAASLSFGSGGSSTKVFTLGEPVERLGHARTMTHGGESPTSGEGSTIKATPPAVPFVPHFIKKTYTGKMRRV